MKYIYILKTGETFPSTKEKLGDFDNWVINFLGKSAKNIKVIEILKDQKLPNLNSAKGFIITGSHSMVSQELSWSVQLEKYIKKISQKDIPLLGICYGHQLIAKALGGKSDFNKKGKEIGTRKITLSQKSYQDPLLQNFPKQFNAFETHYQTAVKLPAGATILASNYKENHQAVRFRKNIWGVQFHPEFDKNIMKEYIINQKDDLEKLHFKADTLLQNVKRCDRSNTVLVNFLNIIKNNQTNNYSSNKKGA